MYKAKVNLLVNEEQLTFFDDEMESISPYYCEKQQGNPKTQEGILNVSERLLNELSIMSIPFIGCDYDKTYIKVAKILPKETVNFMHFGLSKGIACELICASICHQINWDFLRKAVYQKVEKDFDWIGVDNLCNINENDVFKMLKNYNKPERIHEIERANLLRSVGNMVKSAGGYIELFFDDKMNLLPLDKIRKPFEACPTFSSDPNEKKFQLLIQKLSNFDELNGLSEFYKPAIDYHLIRCYLRRGLLYPNTKYAEKYINDSFISRQESTIGAVRELCSNLMQEICWFTSLNIKTVNLVEWHIGRSVCKLEKPDCHLEDKESQWLKESFTKCPFYENCIACQYKKEYLNLQGPSYKGTSF